MDIYQPRTTQEEMTRHFIRMAEGHRPEKSRDGKLSLFPQSGTGNAEHQPCLKLVTPVAQAVEQAKSDLKRGSDQMDVYDEALERDAKRKKMSEARRVRRSKVTKKNVNQRATSKKPKKRTTPKKTVNKKTKPKKTTTGKKPRKQTPGKKKTKPKKTTTGKKPRKQTPGKKKTASKKGQKPKKKSTNGKTLKAKSKRK